MKSLSKLIINIFIVLFCIGSLVSAYVLYKLPENIIAHAQTIHLKQIEQAGPVFDMLYLALGLTLVIGMLTITLTLVFRSGYKEQYKAKEAQKRTSAELVSEQEKEHNYTLKIEGIEELIHTTNDKEALFTKALSSVCTQLEASQAAAYEVKHHEKTRFIEMFASYAHHIPEGEAVTYRFGEGIAGQAAKDGKPLNIKAVPEGYLSVVSGLGKATPKHLLVLPVKNDEEVVGVIEIASFKEFSDAHENAIRQTFDKLALKLANNDNVSLEQAKP